MIREEARNILESLSSDLWRELHPSQRDALDMAIEALKQKPQWVPLKYRPMTKEEVQETEETWGIKLTIDKRVCFDCSMPEDDQEILVCTKWGHIFIDRCEYDPDYGYGLETNGDFDGIVAWLQLPEPYKEEGDPE